MSGRPIKRTLRGDGRRLRGVTAGDPRTEGTDQTEDVGTTKTGESTHTATSGQPAESLSYETSSLVRIGLTTYSPQPLSGRSPPTSIGSPPPAQKMESSLASPSCSQRGEGLFGRLEVRTVGREEPESGTGHVLNPNKRGS